MDCLKLVVRELSTRLFGYDCRLSQLQIFLTVLNHILGLGHLFVTKAWNDRGLGKHPKSTSVIKVLL
jgi:hypothetical protein